MFNRSGLGPTLNHPIDPTDSNPFGSDWGLNGWLYKLLQNWPQYRGIENSFRKNKATSCLPYVTLISEVGSALATLVYAVPLTLPQTLPIHPVVATRTSSLHSWNRPTSENLNEVIKEGKNMKTLWRITNQCCRVALFQRYDRQDPKCAHGWANSCYMKFSPWCARNEGTRGIRQRRCLWSGSLLRMILYWWVSPLCSLSFPNLSPLCFDGPIQALMCFRSAVLLT